MHQKEKYGSQHTRILFPSESLSRRLFFSRLSVRRCCAMLFFLYCVQSLAHLLEQGGVECHRRIA